MEHFQSRNILTGEAKVEMAKQLASPDYIPRRYSGTVVSTWEDGRELVRHDNFESQVQAYKEWVYVCANRNASNIAKIPFKLFVGIKPNGRLLVPTREVSPSTLKYLNNSPGLQNYVTKASDIKEIVDHPFLTLIKTVNPFMDRFSLWENTGVFLELTGNAYWYIYRNKLGIAEQIWLIPSQFMKIVPSKTKFIVGYIYRRGTELVPFNLNEILHFKYPNPHNLYYGMSPLAAISNTININENMDKFENALFTNNARPEGVLETDFEISEDVFNRTKEQWSQNYTGQNKVGKTPVLEKGLKYKAITFPPRELAFLSGRKNILEIVANAFGMPLSMITSENVNLANAYVGDRQYASNTILPKLRRIEETINGRFLPMYDENIFMAFDNPVPEDKDFELKERVADIKVGYKTINEIRASNGLKPVEWGNKPLDNKPEGASLANQNAVKDIEDIFTSNSL